jgi:hypothetical protein
MSLWVHESKTIMKPVGEEEEKRLVKIRFEVAREGRKRKQAERRRMMRKCGLRLQNWRDKLDPPSHSPEAQEEIPLLFGDDIEEETPKRFMEELNRFAQMEPGDTMNRKFAEFPTVRRFAFLLSSTSRSALRLARHFLPLPCPKTACHHDQARVTNAKSALMDINRLDDQITAFVEINGLRDDAFVSVAADAMTMTPDRSCLPGNAPDY